MTDNTKHKKTLNNSAESFWLVPTSGFGHVADEQPLPFITLRNRPLTPRFGGEESQKESSIQSLPLPWGKLESSWPIKQKIFNLFRRRVNIYWRNLFNDISRRDGHFYFSEQLDYVGLEDSFIGNSPLIEFKRQFVYKNEGIEIKDFIRFKENISFSIFNYAMVPQLTSADDDVKCLVTCDVVSNEQSLMSSSTGLFVMKFKQLTNVDFLKDDYICVNYQYEIKNEL